MRKVGIPLLGAIGIGLAATAFSILPSTPQAPARSVASKVPAWNGWHGLLPEDDDKGGVSSMVSVYRIDSASEAASAHFDAKAEWLRTYNHTKAEANAVLSVHQNGRWIVVKNLTVPPGTKGTSNMSLPEGLRTRLTLDMLAGNASDGVTGGRT